MDKTIKLIVLISGDQIIGKVEEDNPAVTIVSDYVHIESPRATHMTIEGGVGFTPYPLGIVQNRNVTIKVPREHVTLMMEPDPEFEKEYIAGISNITL